MRLSGYKFNYRKISSVILVMTLLMPVVCTADTPDLLSEQAFLHEVPIVLSVTRLAQPIRDVPAAITVIDHELIEATGYKEFTDVLRLVPGLQVEYAFGNRPTISYHGLRDTLARRMQVLVDGRSIFLPDIGSVEWVDHAIAVEDIERIEVIRSPNAATYGSNSFQGVINIVIRHPVVDQGAYVRTTAGNNDIREQIVRYGTKIKDGHMRVTAGVRSEDTLFDRFNDGKTLPFGNFRLDYPISTNDTLEIDIGGSGGTRDEGRDGDTEDPPHRRDVRFNHSLLRWIRSFSPEREIQIQAYFNNYYSIEDFSTDPIDLPGLGQGIRVPFKLERDEERLDVEARYTISLNENLRSVWGGSIRRDKFRSPGFLGTDTTLNSDTYRLFSTLEQRFANQAVFNFGLMTEYNDFTGAEFAPRVAYNYHLNPLQTLRFSASSATRIPTFAEENFNSRAEFNGIVLDQFEFATQDLDPERIRAFDIGYLGESESGRVHWDIKLFHERVKDLISEVDVPFPDLADGEARDFFNRGFATIQGAEGQFTFWLGKYSRLILTHTELDIDGSDFIPRQNISISGPRRSSSLFLSHTINDKWRFSTTWYRVGGGQPLGSLLEAGTIYRTDFNIARSFHWGNVSGKLSATIENVFNRENPEFKDRQFFDRRGYVGLSFDWQ